MLKKAISSDTKSKTDFIKPKYLRQISRNSEIYLDDKPISFEDFYISLGLDSTARLKAFYYLSDNNRIKLKVKK